MAPVWVLLISVSLPSLSICKTPEAAVAFDHNKHGRALQENEQPNGNVDCHDLTKKECENMKENSASRAGFKDEMAGATEGLGVNLPGVTKFAPLLIGPILALVISCIYKPRITDKRPPFQIRPADMDFETGLCDCWSDCPICLSIWICLPARAGDTLATAEVVSFWAPVLLLSLLMPLVFVACTLLGTVVVNKTLLSVLYPLQWLVCALVFAKWRGNLRKRFFMQDGNNHFMMDFFIHCCCSPCALGQEAVELDRVTGVETKCCDVLVGEAILTG